MFGRRVDEIDFLKNREEKSRWLGYNFCCCFATQRQWLCDLVMFLIDPFYDDDRL